MRRFDSAAGNKKYLHYLLVQKFVSIFALAYYILLSWANFKN